MATVEALGLHKSFGDVDALRGVSLSVEEGEILGVLGPNGAGKSTILRMLIGAQRPDEGRVEFEGLRMAETDAAIRRDPEWIPNISSIFHHIWFACHRDA